MQAFIPGFIRDPAVAVVGEKCYRTLIEELHLLDTECLRLALSKGLGIGIVVGGSIMKLPQLMTIVRAKSARGISLPAYVLETTSYAIATAYSSRNRYPFSTYGENFFLTLQNIIITFLIIHFSFQRRSLTSKMESNAPRLIIAGAVTLLGGYALYYIPLPTLAALQVSTVPLSVFSKLPQISQNYKAKSTGHLSSFAVVSQIAGCLARVFTTSTEVGDPVVLTGFIVALLLNLVLGAQMWTYWGKGQQEMNLDETVSMTPTQYEKVDIVISPASPSTQGGRRWARKVD